jgi:hypothetical protein
MPQPLKELGTFSVAIKLHRDVVPKISVTLVKKDAEESAPEGEPAQNQADEAATE